MIVLVTGATGKIGRPLVRALSGDGYDVRALVRDPARLNGDLPAGVVAIRGYITNPESLRAAVDGCSLVFNAMGIPERWVRDHAEFERVNADGTANLVRAAAAAGVPRVVHTSTINVFAASTGGRFDESDLATSPKPNPYDRSKQRAEELALSECGDTEVVFVNPAAVYGSPPYQTGSMERDVFEPLTRGRLPALPPGGYGIVHADGVAHGHLLAARHGRHGERYILSDTHVTLRDLARAVVRISGGGRVPPSMPTPFAAAVAAASELGSRLTGTPPMLARGQLAFMRWNSVPDSSRAQKELGWQPTGLEVGIRSVLDSLGPQTTAPGS